MIISGSNNVTCSRTACE